MKKFVLLAPAVALVLAGCAHDPRIAATVAGQRVSASDVDLMTSVLCSSISNQSGAQATPMSQVKTIATTYLVGTKALADIAGRNGATVPALTSPQTVQLVAALPASQRARAAALVDEVQSAGNFVAQQAGASSSQQVLSILASLVQSEGKDGRLSSNPAYPTLAADSSGSLSAPISGAAQAAGSAQPAPDYLVALPAGQKCG